MGVGVHRSTVMRQIHDPVEMYDAGTVVTASLVVALASVGLVLALQWPAILLVAGAGVLVASTARRQDGIRHRRDADRRARQVCSPDTGVCVKV